MLEQGELADKTNIGVATIRRMEKGERTANTDELAAIAEVAGLPFEFFTADLQQLKEPNAAKDMEARLEKVEKALNLHEANAEAFKALMDLVENQPHKKNVPEQ